MKERECELQECIQCKDTKRFITKDKTELIKHYGRHEQLCSKKNKS